MCVCVCDRARCSCQGEKVTPCDLFRLWPTERSSVYLHIDRLWEELAVCFQDASPWAMFCLVEGRLYPWQRDYYGGITLKWCVKKVQVSPFMSFDCGNAFVALLFFFLFFFCEDNCWWQREGLCAQVWKWPVRTAEQMILFFARHQTPSSLMPTLFCHLNSMLRSWRWSLSQCRTAAPPVAAAKKVSRSPSVICLSQRESCTYASHNSRWC